MGKTNCGAALTCDLCGKEILQLGESLPAGWTHIWIEVEHQDRCLTRHGYMKEGYLCGRKCLMKWYKAQAPKFV